MGPLAASPAVVAEQTAAATSNDARRSVLASFTDDVTAWMSELRYSTANRRATERLVDGFEVMRTTNGVDPATVRRLVVSVGRDGMPRLFDGAAALGITVDPWTEQLSELESSEDLDDLGSPLSGGDIIELIDTPPGPVVGEFTRRLAEVRIVDGPLSRDRAVALVREWAAAEVATELANSREEANRDRR